MVFQTLAFLHHSLVDFSASFLVYGRRETRALFRRFRRVKTVDWINQRARKSRQLFISISDLYWLLGFLKLDKNRTKKKRGKLKHLVFLETTVNSCGERADNQVFWRG